ncbi:MAG: hypothetical protein ACO3JL_10570 [Myxococcota bacterium]
MRAITRFDVPSRLLRLSLLVTAAAFGAPACDGGECADAEDCPDEQVCTEATCVAAKGEGLPVAGGGGDGDPLDTTGGGTTGGDTSGGGTTGGDTNGGGTTGGGTTGGGTTGGDTSGGGTTGGGTTGDGTSGDDTTGGDTGPGDGAGTSDPVDPTCQPSGERCSFVDEDCDGENNEGLDCTFLASTKSGLYQVDPFAQTATLLRTVSFPVVSEYIFDIATAPGGMVYATTGARKLYQLDPSGPVAVTLTPDDNSSDSFYDLPFNPNGLAIGGDGSFYVSNFDSATSSKVVMGADLTTKPGLLTTLTGFDSAGDCVINKGALLLSADGGDGGASDILIQLPWDSLEPIVIGAFGYDGVFGLSEAFGELFGVTEDGKVLLIDSDTGAAELLFDTDLIFTGAASDR